LSAPWISRPRGFRGDQAGPAPGRKAARAGRALSRWVSGVDFWGHPPYPQPKKFGQEQTLLFAEKSADTGGTLIGLRGLFRL